MAKFTKLIKDNSSIGFDINGVIEQYKVNAGANVSAGDFVEFLIKWGSGTFADPKTYHTAACSLDENRVLVVYRDASTDYGMALIISLLGQSMIVGEPLTFRRTSTSAINVVKLTDSKVYIQFAALTSSSSSTIANYIALLHIDNMTVSVGSLTTVTNGYSKVAVGLSSTKILMVDTDTSTSKHYPRAKLITVNEDDSLTVGNAVTFDTSYSRYISITMMTESTALVTYEREMSSGRVGAAIMLRIDDTTISYGSIMTFESGGSIDNASLTALSSTKAVVAYRLASSIYDKKIAVLSVNDMTVTSGTPLLWSEDNGAMGGLIRLSEDRALLVFGNWGDDNYVGAVVLTITGSTAVPGEIVRLYTGSSGSYTTSVLVKDNVVIVLTTVDTARYYSLYIDETTINVSETSGMVVQPATSRTVNVGVAKTAGSSGETIDVYCVNEET